MRKRIALIMPFLVLAVLLGLTGNVQAVPISGFVHLEGGYDPLSGAATYSFLNVNDPQTNFKLIGLGLIFEADVFDLAATSVNAPTGWIVTNWGGSNYELAFVLGLPGIPEGGALTFTANYTLLGPANSLSWDFGVWKQGFGALLVPDGGWPIAIITGGSTSPAPEPTSILLLGSGLVGLGLLGRRRLKAKIRGRDQHS